MDGQTQGMSKEKYTPPPQHTLTQFSRPSTCRWSSTSHPELSGLNQGNIWETNGFCLVHMKKEIRLSELQRQLALPSVPQFLFQLSSSSSVLPAILSEACVTAVKMEGWRKDKRTESLLTGPLPIPTPSAEPRQIRVVVLCQEDPLACVPSSQSQWETWFLKIRLF